MKKSKISLMCISLILFCNVSLAQTSTTGNSIRRNIATIMFTSLGGAVLGLSTLSFYGEPQQHIGNIWMGLGLGAIAGSAYVLSESGNSYSGMTKLSDQDLNKITRTQHLDQRIPMFSWQWTFN